MWLLGVGELKFPHCPCEMPMLVACGEFSYRQPARRWDCHLTILKVEGAKYRST